MANVLDRLSSQMNQAGVAQRTAKARTWLRNKVSELRSVRRNTIIQDKSRSVTGFYPGRMYFYFYDPKMKKTLPYYDKFPLVIPVEKYKDGFLGLNLHYLPVKYRIILLDKLYDTLNNDRYDDTTKMQLSYDLLAGAARYEEFKPCLKRYLTSHIASGLIEIEPSNWEIALFLPVEMFVGATKEQVHRESLEMI
jgi:hypothetical protein